MNRLLALDIGITTGYAVWVYVQGEWMVFTYGELHRVEYQSHLRLVLRERRVEFTVAERPVIYRGKLGEQLQMLVNATIEECQPQLEFIEPADWKPSPSKKYPTPRGTSTHVKDAIRIGHWYKGRLKTLPATDMTTHDE